MDEGWWPGLLQGCCEEVVAARGTLFNYIYFIVYNVQKTWWMDGVLKLG
jgi:hypothetical protein